MKWLRPSNSTDMSHQFQEILHSLSNDQRTLEANTHSLLSWIDDELQWLTLDINYVVSEQAEVTNHSYRKLSRLQFKVKEGAATGMWLFT